MEFRLLGPLEVRDDEGRPLDAGPPLQRALLAMMLLHVGSVVSVDTFIAGLWDGDPPSSAERSVHATVSQLRKRLGPGVRTERTGSGYRLDVATEAIDLTAFERLSSEGRSALARGKSTEAADMLGRAMALYRGRPLLEFIDRPFAGVHALRIERLISSTEEDFVDAQLAIGRHDESLTIIERLVREEPLRERRWGQLMTALYLSGRRVDALEAFQRARHTLVGELGLEPGPELRRLEADIRTQSLPETTPLPRGAVTFLLTDVAGSVSLWERASAAMAASIARHDEIAREIVDRNGGMLRKTRGEGDSTFSVFVGPSDAVKAALEFQLALNAEHWPDPIRLSVRAAVHTGEAELRDADYYGPAVNRAARARGVAHGGQVLVTAATAELVSDTLPADTSLRDLGQYRLRDLSRPEHLFQLTHPALETDFDPLANSDRVTLPSRSSTFVERDKELDAVASALAGARLVTLTGPGGCGKTSLAIAVAAATAQAYSDGVVFVDLAPVSSAELVPNAVAAALEIRERPGQTLTESIAAYLGSERRLLLLDNCEHVTAGARSVVDAVLRAGPTVRVLATSREHLGPPGEVIWLVPPLEEEHAIRLFEERATSACPTFDAGEQRTAVARLCERLDGMPLAIELAAGRVNALSVEQITDRLDDALRLLGDTSVITSTRQRTLRATFEWSYDLLSEPERLLFAHLAVFAGGFTLEAVEAVVTEQDVAGQDVGDEDVVGCFVRLVDKSLVMRVDYAEQSQPRYRLLEPLRQFARSRLVAEGRERQARDAHLAYYVRFAEGAEPHLYLAGSRQWSDRIDRETANFRAALEWAFAPDGGDAQAGARLVGALAWAWFASGRIAEGMPWANAALCATSAQRSHVRGRALYAAALLSSAHSDLDAVATHSTELRELADELDILYLRGCGRDMLGIALWARGDLDNAIKVHREAVDLFTECQDGFMTAIGNAELGRALAAADRSAEAGAAFEAGVTRARALQEDTALGLTLDGSALFALGGGDLTSAGALIDEAVDHYRASGYQEGLASGLNTRALVAVATEDHDAAARDYTEAVELCRRLGHVGGVATSLDGLAHVAQHRGDLAGAVERCAAAQGLRARVGLASSPQEQENVDSLLAGLRSVLGQESFDRAWINGRSRDLDQLDALIAPSGST